MFVIFNVETYNNGRCSSRIRIAKSGLEAVRQREKMGLPASTEDEIRFQIPEAPVVDRRAAESWPEALDSKADLPKVYNTYNGPNELSDMIKSGILIFGPPTKIDNDIGITLKLTCSPFELVCWRRSWAAEQRAELAEKRLRELESEDDE